MLAKSLSNADRLWIKSLNRHEGNPTNGTVMTEDEEARLISLVKTHGLPCLMAGFVYGFGIEVFDIPTKNGEKPKRLASISGFLKLPPHGDEATQALHVAEVLTHTPENAEVLKFYGFESLRDPISYCY